MGERRWVISFIAWHREIVAKIQIFKKESLLAEAASLLHWHKPFNAWYSLIKIIPGASVWKAVFCEFLIVFLQGSGMISDAQPRVLCRTWRITKLFSAVHLVRALRLKPLAELLQVSGEVSSLSSSSQSCCCWHLLQGGRNEGVPFCSQEKV